MAHSELHCPHCGSNQLYIYDHQLLPDEELRFGKKISVRLKCDFCNDTFETEGEITYKELIPISRNN